MANFKNVQTIRRKPAVPKGVINKRTWGFSASSGTPDVDAAACRLQITAVTGTG